MRIVGICLLRNEENFVAWSLMNIAHFCDEIIVLDNMSDDRTPEILEAISRRFKHVRVTVVEDAYDTHKYVASYAGEDCWVFGVDGDEIYDPRGLARLRPRILSGEFQNYWRLIGHAQHVADIDWARTIALGYGQPEARSITKLYNFAAIDSWRQGRHERLHGKAMMFRPGYSRESAYRFWDTAPWDSSDLRCLHMCFSRRSTADEKLGRANPSEVMKARSLRRRLATAVGLYHFDPKRTSTYKQRFYARGPVTEVGIESFGRPDDWRDIDPLTLAAEASLPGRREDDLRRRELVASI